ncbi:MAG TPA: PPC domain-containing DNA-binding protein [Candidatus Polarisedimenticolia bacterium]|nr:PPC domain-containing DNA-binding protein [Candidatus Polarisedimenticolia bacterium]
MTYKRVNDRIIVRLDIGDEVIESLKTLARIERIPGGALTGLGAVGDVTLAYYHLKSRSYETVRLEEDVEVVSLTGNIGWLGDEPVIHAHAVVSRADCSTAGGHVMRAVVSVTVEVMVLVYAERLERAPVPEIGLNLLRLGPPQE